MENIYRISLYLPDGYYSIFQKYQFAIVVSGIAAIGFGILLIGLSALVAVRGFVNKKQRNDPVN